MNTHFNFSSPATHTCVNKRKRKRKRWPFPTTEKTIKVGELQKKRKKKRSSTSIIQVVCLPRRRFILSNLKYRVVCLPYTVRIPSLCLSFFTFALPKFSISPSLSLSLKVIMHVWFSVWSSYSFHFRSFSFLGLCFIEFVMLALRIVDLICIICLMYIDSLWRNDFFITRLWFGTLFLRSWVFFFFFLGGVICGNWFWSQLMIWVRDWLIIRRFRYHMLTNCWKKGFKVLEY